MTNQETVMQLAELLLMRAAELWMNVTITRVPNHPLAMGNVRNVIEVWPLRQQAEPTVQHLPSCDTEGGEL